MPRTPSSVAQELELLGSSCGSIALEIKMQLTKHLDHPDEFGPDDRPWIEHLSRRMLDVEMLLARVRHEMNSAPWESP
jgi:hypothetical protein